MVTRVVELGVQGRGGEVRARREREGRKEEKSRGCGCRVPSFVGILFEARDNNWPELCERGTGKPTELDSKKGEEPPKMVHNRGISNDLLPDD